jgi:F0F1-type ATP synthase assembly protein I
MNKHHADMPAKPNASGDDSSFSALLYQWSVRVSVIALEMVIPAVVGVGLDRLFGTKVLFVILGIFLGMALGFWQLLKLAHSIGVDKSPDTEDNKPI